jgi:hypothetical protein
MDDRESVQRVDVARDNFCELREDLEHPPRGARVADDRREIERAPFRAVGRSETGLSSVCIYFSPSSVTFGKKGVKKT